MNSLFAFADHDPLDWPVVGEESFEFALLRSIYIIPTDLPLLFHSKAFSPVLVI